MPDEELTLILKLRDEATAQMKKAQAGIGGSVKKIAKVAAAAALVIGAAVGAAGVKLFKLASDAEEADNVIGLAFGSMKQQAIDWSETFAAATGSSKFESRELAADLGLIIRGMGFTEEATLGMSTQMVELAADMSSAKNVPLAEALDKIRAGLIGESEPLRTMGVLLSEARVKQEAYASGIAKTGAELTVQQKVQARMNIILSDSVAMHGDLVNTQDSAANQWRAIKNAVKDNLTMLGQHFMPVFVKVLGYIRDGVNYSIEFAKSLYKSSQETNRYSTLLGNLVMWLKIAWNVLKPLVMLLKDGLGWVFKNVLIPVLDVFIDAWNKMFAQLQTGYNFLARLVPGLEEVAVATMDVSKATDILGSTTMPAATEATFDMAHALSGGEGSLVEAFEETATVAEDSAERMRLAQRQFVHDAVIARNQLREANRLIEERETADIAEALEERRLQKVRWKHDAIIARNEVRQANREAADAEIAAAGEVQAALEEVTDSTGLWGKSITDVGNVMINQFIPGPLRGLTGGINAAFSSIMGKGGGGLAPGQHGPPEKGGGLMGAFSAFTGAIGPAGFIALEVNLLIKHFGKIIAGLKKIIGWVKSAFGWFGRLFGIGKKANQELRSSPAAEDRPDRQSDPLKLHRGGPATAGQTYSTIPGEIFIPSTNGTVVNPGLIDYDRLGAAVAAAMQRVPLVVPQDAVTDSILRRTPNRQALRGWA